MRHLVFILLLLAAPVLAQQGPLPALYDVSGVDAADVLNIRASANAEAEIIGSLPHDARNVEVVAVNDTGTWGRVNIGERSGWTSLAFLSRQEGQAGGTFPQVASCFGTEPFWSFSRDPGGKETWVLMGPDEEGLLVEEHWRGAASGRTDRFGLVVGNGMVEGRSVISYAACTDGMSDRTYGLSFDLLLSPKGGTPQLISGCCTLGQ